MEMSASDVRLHSGNIFDPKDAIAKSARLETDKYRGKSLTQLVMSKLGSGFEKAGFGF